MYNALTPLGGHVTNADLFSDFKSEAFGLGTDGPGTPEPVPYPGVTIIRDRFDVPARHRDHARRRRLGGRLDRRRGPRAAAAAGPLRLAGRGHRRPGSERDRPGRAPQELRPQPADRERRRPPDPGPAQGRARGPRRPARHRRLPHRDQRLPDVDALDRGAVHAQRHLRLQRAQGPVLRRGRRRRGQPLDVPRRRSSGGSASRRATACSTTCARTSTPAARRPSTARSTTSTIPTKPGAPGSVVLNPGSFKTTPAGPAGGDRQRARAGAAPARLQRADGRGQVLHHRPSAARRRPAGRLLLSRPHLRDRHARPRVWTGAAPPPRRSRATC